MLYYRAAPGGEGYALNLANAPDGPAPLDYHRDTPETHEVQLRGAYASKPRPFVQLAQRAHDDDLTLVSADGPDLAETLYRALVAVAETKRWHIAGGAREAAPTNLSGWYVP